MPSMTMRPKGRRVSPPFSYVLFTIAIVEALCYFAPIMESSMPLLQPAITSLTGHINHTPAWEVEAEGKRFIDTLCEYLTRENVNLKRTTQRWKVVGIEEQEEYQQLYQARSNISVIDAAIHAQQVAELRSINAAQSLGLSALTKGGSSAEMARRNLVSSTSALDLATISAFHFSSARGNAKQGKQAIDYVAELVTSSESFALYIRVIASIFVTYEVYAKFFRNTKRNNVATLLCCTVLIINIACLPVYAEETTSVITAPSSTKNEVSDVEEYSASAFTCKGAASCSHHGSCASDDACKCDPGWEGPDCSIGVHNSLFKAIIGCKPLLIMICAMAAVSYLILCGWLSVSWLHFAKALVIWHKRVRTPSLPSLSSSLLSASPISTSPLASASSRDAEDEEDSEAQLPSVPAAPVRFFRNEQEEHSLLGRASLMVRECRYKINVVHDALLTFSSLFKPMDLPLFATNVVPPTPIHSFKERE